MIKFLLSNPAVMSRVPNFVLWLLGMGGTSAVAKAVQNIHPNTINHILQAKHKWSSLGGNTWNIASKAILYVLTHSKSIPYKAGNVIYTAIYKGEIIQVSARFINGVLRIVDAWVK
jgi:hypothetical protein